MDHTIYKDKKSDSTDHGLKSTWKPENKCGIK